MVELWHADRNAFWINALCLGGLMNSDKILHCFDQTALGPLSGQKDQHATCYLGESNLYLRLYLALPCFGRCIVDDNSSPRFSHSRDLRELGYPPPVFL